jgi:Coenzyme PQQ synthesis protein D (PqqD)
MKNLALPFLALAVLAFQPACRPRQHAPSMDAATADHLKQFGAGDPAGIFPRVRPDVAYKVYDGRAVIVNPTRAEVHVLNETGSKILTLLDGRHSIPQVAHAVVQEFDVDERTAFRDTVEFLSALKEKGMLVDSSEDMSDKPAD